MRYSPLIVLFACLMASLFSCNSSNDLDRQLIGRWEMGKVYIFGEDVSSDLNPGNDRWIQFYPDGSFISGGGLGRNTGSYLLNDGKLSLDSEAGPGDDSDWEIEIRNDSLLFMGMGSDRQEQSLIINTRGDTTQLAISYQTKEFDSSIRALEISGTGEIWIAGSKGFVANSTDNGLSWNSQNIEYADKTPEFRSLAVTNKSAFILSVGSPALLYGSNDRGQNWELKYSETDSSAFYDSMEFWDDQDGIAVGDAMDGCMSVIITRDGGNSWNKIPCEQLPEAMEGEGCFAASDTNLVLKGNHVWIATTKSRVMHSADKGSTWSITSTPILKGKAMTGIYSIAFRDTLNGIIFGGDWEEKDTNASNKAITTDGGNSWTLVSDGDTPGYRSCVQYLNDSVLFAVGSPGISLSEDGGYHWQDISTSGFYTIRFDEDGSEGWLGGNGKIARLQIN